MKHYSKILFIAAAFTGLVSCALDEVKEFPVEQPANLAEYEYLNEYDVLKNYVDRTASPDFKLGAGVTASAFVNHGQEYLMSVSNFDEVTPFTEMNHAAIVANNGKMSFDDVKSFVNDAKNAGITVYGNALGWHAQQNNKFLNTLIADFIDPDYVPELVEKTFYEKRTCVMVEALDMKEQAWDSQFWIATPDITYKEGDSWEISMDIYAIKEASPGTQIHAAPSAYLHWAAIGNPAFKTEWSTWSASGTFPAEGAGGYSIAFNLNDFQEANTYYFDNVSFKVNGVEQIVNGTFDDPETNVNFYSKTYGQDANPRLATIVDEYKVIKMVEIPKTEDVQRTCILVESENMASAAWDTQFWLYFPDTPMKEGDTWEVSMEVMAEKESYAGTQTHVGPGGYIHWAAIGNVTFTTEWTTYTAKGTVDGSMNTGDAIAFNLNDFQEANKYYFDNLSFKLNGVEVLANGSCDDPAGNANFIAKEYGKGGQTVPATIVDHYTVVLPGGATPQTPEQKKDTLTTALDKWIKGVMGATAGQVKAWDAVKDLYAEKVDDGSHFYWQDYIGEDDYVKMVFSKARAYYASADVDGDGNADNNNPEELKLFVSEGGLENAEKLAALVDKIKAWEADSDVKIDGIAVQLHVNYLLDADAQAAQEEAIAAMFTKLAETGKLIKVSELNIGVAEAAGAAEMAPSAVTEEQHRAVAEFYKYVVSKYIETVPVANQYGITKWNTSDSATSATGLWDANYGRKHTYAGFAAGLSGK